MTCNLRAIDDNPGTVTTGSPGRQASRIDDARRRGNVEGAPGH